MNQRIYWHPGRFYLTSIDKLRLISLYLTTLATNSSILQPLLDETVDCERIGDREFRLSIFQGVLQKSNLFEIGLLIIDLLTVIGCGQEAIAVGAVRFAVFAGAAVR